MSGNCDCTHSPLLITYIYFKGNSMAGLNSIMCGQLLLEVYWNRCKHIRNVSLPHTIKYCLESNKLNFFYAFRFLTSVMYLVTVIV